MSRHRRILGAASSLLACVACSGSPATVRGDSGPGTAADSGRTSGIEGGGALDGAPGGRSADASDSGPGDGAAVAMFDAAGYPVGPYGNALGDTLIDLPLQGYLNEAGVGLSDLQPFVKAYSLEELRRTGSRYALIHVSAFF